MARANTISPRKGHREITIHELTVAQIRDWLRDLEHTPEDAGDEDVDVLGQLLFEDFTLGDLLRVSDATREEIDQLKPSEIRRIATKARELNPDFFAMRERLDRVGQAVLDSGHTPSAPES